MTTSHIPQKIVPCVWFDGNADEAAHFYTSIFRDAEIGTVARYPSDADSLPDFQRELAGQPLTLALHIAGSELQLLNAGAEFQPNPSINFMLHFDPAVIPDAREYLDEVHAALLADGGWELMPLQEYPFSPHYAWVQDRYGVSWQLMLTGPNAIDAGSESTVSLPFVMPSFMFGGSHQNECVPAVDTYMDLIPDSVLHTRHTYDSIGGVPDMGPDITSPVTPASVAYSDFTLGGVWFTAMDSGAPQPFTFNEGVSLILYCADQEEIDRYWEALSTDPAAEACGWCRDAFGVSWQVVPANWEEISKRPGAHQKIIGQKKIVIADY